ncbi:MAG: four helix bundle protein [Candidatus Magasanikbacteria bacterium]|nr:four helix bundle protein [Candidatus Magasanikbacteria bacterium]
MEGDFSKLSREEFWKQLKARIYNWTVRLTKYARKILKNLPKELHSIIDQLIRAGTSVCANYIEAQGSPTTKDFRNFLSHALKSCNESKYWLSLIKDTKIDDSEELEWLIKEGVEISNILGKSVSTMYKS